MDKIELSRHIIKDRLERMVKIATTIGYGNIIKEFVTQGKYGQIRQCLTDTGIMILKELNSDKVITVYAIRLSRVIALYRTEAPNERIPQKLYTAIINNEKKRPYLFNVNK